MPKDGIACVDLLAVVKDAQVLRATKGRAAASVFGEEMARYW